MLHKYTKGTKSIKSSAISKETTAKRFAELYEIVAEIDIYDGQ